MEFLITTIVAVILLVRVVTSCPSVCNCSENANRLHVDCSNRGLDSIPTDLPNNTYAFDLYSNQITSIQEGTFSKLTSLSYLFLYSNQITSIQEGTFNNLRNLTHLYLYSNQITSIQSGAFNLPRLTRLLLRSNPISFVSENTFQNLPPLILLEFDMHCIDCNNIPFWRWIKRNQMFSKSVTCNDHDGEKLSSLKPNDFTDCIKRFAERVIRNGGQTKQRPKEDEGSPWSSSYDSRIYNYLLDPCYSNPCLNNGLCTNDGEGSALCSCHGDWTGSQCELSPCNNAVCNDEECYYNESGIAKCFNQAEKYCQE